MTKIKQQHFVESICDALQYISYFHPPEFIEALSQAYKIEKSPAAKDAIAQILTNSRLCAEGHRPICQDTGIVIVFLKIGMHVQWDTNQSISDMVNQAVHNAYTHTDNPLRASIVENPSGKRNNTGDNTPAVIHTEMVTGDKIDIIVAAKGGGSENKSKFVVLNPNDNIVNWVLDTVPTMGAGWCPPGILGIGIGGSAEKAMLMAKEATMEPLNIHELKSKSSKTHIEKLRLEIYNKVNALGIGAQGLGGLTTVLDVKIREYPTHATSKPVAIIPNCAATRHVHFQLDGSGPVKLVPPSLSRWPKLVWKAQPNARHVNLNQITKDTIATWRAGETLLLNGRLLTGRDAAHYKISQLIQTKKALPNGLDFKDRFIYYVGPVTAIGNEHVGPAGPTTATRMDKYTDMMLGNLGVLGMIGKAERGQDTIDLIKKYQTVYLTATGGAAYLISKAIKASKVVAFSELGMEAIYEFTVKDLPVMVAVDTLGNSIHQMGPAQWRNKSTPINITFPK